MNLLVLKSLNERAQGVINREPTGFEDVFLFAPIYSGDSFHMRGVEGALDIIFLDKEFGVITINRDVIPETGGASAPPSTAYAVEVKAGGADYYGLVRGEVWVDLTNQVLNEGAL